MSVPEPGNIYRRLEREHQRRVERGLWLFVPLVFGVSVYVVVTDGPTFKLVLALALLPVAVVVRASERWQARRK